MTAHIKWSLDAILCHHPGVGILLMGDFNRMKDRYIKSSFSLKHIVPRATRGEAILDYIYANIKQHYGIPSIEPPIGMSDHRIVICHPQSRSET